jgi:hypothetical protein
VAPSSGWGLDGDVNMVGHRSDNEWEKMGKVDPYYGVVTLDKFRRDQLTDESLDEFFKSGSDHIEFIVDRIRSHLDSNFSPERGMDFGCGVGRCTIPMASVCKSVVGIDISRAMLDEGKRNCEKRSVTNIEFTRSDDQLSNISGSFGFVHSFIVFQHIPPRRGERIFERQVEMLADGGVGAVQFVYRRDVSAAVRFAGALRKRIPFLHNLLNLASGKPFSEPLVEKNCYNLNRIMGILHRHGCSNVYVMFEGETTLRSVLVLFQKRKESLPYEAFYNQAGTDETTDRSRSRDA